MSEPRSDRSDHDDLVDMVETFERERNDARSQCMVLRQEIQGCIDRNELVRTMLERERDAALDRAERAELALREAPKVECACHPGVRWPTEQWGKPCPISAAESERDAARAVAGSLREALEQAIRNIDALCDSYNGVTLHRNDFDVRSMEAALSASSDADGWLREHDAKVREECAKVAEEFPVVPPPKSAILMAESIADAIRALGDGG